MKVAARGLEKKIVFKISMDANLKETEIQSRSCMKVEAAALGSPSLIVFKVSVDVNLNETEIQSSGSV